MKTRNKPESKLTSLDNNKVAPIAQKSYKNDFSPNSKEQKKFATVLRSCLNESELLKDEFQNTKKNIIDTSGKFTELYDFTPSGFFIISKKGKIEELNQIGAEIIGIDRSLLKNKNFTSFISNKSKSIFTLFLKKIFGSTTRQTCEIVLVNYNNQFTYAILTGIVNKNGENCIINLVDFTEKKQFEETSDKKEEKNLAAILQTAMDGFWFVDSNGKILEVNDKYCNMSGFERNELINMNISDLEAIESDKDISRHIKKVISNGEDHFDTLHRRKDGSTFDVELNILYQRENKGRFIVFIHDITRRKHIEEQLLESEQRYRSIFEKSKEAIFLVDLDAGKYSDCNHMATELTGYSHKEILNMKIGEFLPPERKAEITTNINQISGGKVLRNETEIVTKSGKIIPVEFHSSLVSINKKKYILSILHDISKHKTAEKALKQSEERVKSKLHNILSPEGSIANLDLADIIDVQTIQKLMNHFYEMVTVPMAILDMHGTVLVGVGWQDICLKFHRAIPESCKNCVESDMYLTKGIAEGEFKLYKCKNNMWDMATPLIIGGEHLGNLFIGQFFMEDEAVDYDLFISQSDKFNFAKQEYLDSLEKVPRLSRQKLENAKSFFLILAQSISRLSYSNIQLSRLLKQQKIVDNKLKEKESLLNKAQEIAHLGSWSLDLNENLLICSEEMFRIFDLTPKEFKATYEGFLELIHPDDREVFNSAYLKSIQDGKDRYEIEHRIIGKHSGEIRYVLEKYEHVRDSSGKITQSVGMMLDITERKQIADELKEKEKLFRESQTATEIGSYSIDLLKKTWKGTQAVYKIFGIDESFSNSTRDLINCVHPDFRKKLTDDFFSSKSSKSNFEHEYKILRINDGKERWIYMRGKFEYTNQNTPVILIGTIQDITQRKKEEDSLKQLNEELEKRVKERTEELINVSVQVEERERNRFSLEIHDDLGPLLSAIKLYFQWLSETKNPKKKKIIAEKGNNSINKAIETTRLISHGLSSQLLFKMGFLGAIQHFVQSINDMQKIYIDLKFNLEMRFNNFLEITLYRIITELINNTLKYSGATRIEIILNYNIDKNDLNIGYNDNGCGFDLVEVENSGKGIGLLNIHNRIKILNGNIEIKTEVGKGFKVKILIPVENEIISGRYDESLKNDKDEIKNYSL